LLSDDLVFTQAALEQFTANQAAKKEA
jgi:hypothetical protein